jgi:hypothetical protein
MKRVSFVLGTVVAGALAAGCVTGPARSPNPLGHASPNKDLATQEQFPLRSSAVKEEVDRQFEERYPGTINWLFVWGTDRWFDLMDIVSWNIDFGRGFGLNLRATEFLEIGVNWWDGQSWGMRGRTWGVWETHEVDRGLGPFYWVELERRPVYGTQSLFDHDYKYTGWDLHETANPKVTNGDWSEIGGKFHFLAFGAGIRISPVELVDFIAGLCPVGLVANVMGYHEPIPDIMNDDIWSQIKQELEDEKGLEQK